MKRSRSTHPNHPHRPFRTAERIIAFSALGTFLTIVAPHVGHAESACGGDLTSAPAALTSAFTSATERFDGADYQRSIDLPDGRRLWTFQDAFVDRPSGDDALVHNVAVVQDGSCFELLHSGSPERPGSWLGAERTDPRRHWFWPLGAIVARDTVSIFVAEFVEPGPHYLTNAHPVATWLATVDPETLAVRSFAPAPDATDALYGWSVAADDDFAYLYGHCYRQFGFSFVGHDGCTADVTVARTSHDLSRPLEYWDGRGWTSDSAHAINVAPHRAVDGTPRRVNPSQVTRVGNQWVAVTKDGDWWGDRIYVDVASSPTGPFRPATVLDASVADREENNYFANIVATTDGELVLGLSHNRWDGRRSDLYRPTFLSVPRAALMRPLVTAAR